MNHADNSPTRKPNSLLGSLLSLVSSAPKRTEADPPTQSELNEWLILKIAEATGLSPSQIGIDTTFADFGLDSRTAVSMSTDLERLLGRELPPTLIWDYPTINEVSRHLIELSNGEKS